jgi:hypothetical protein
MSVPSGTDVGAIAIERAGSTVFSLEHEARKDVKIKNKRVTRARFLRFMFHTFTRIF